MIVQLEDLEFHPFPDDTFNGFAFEELVGWDDLADAKNEEEERPQDHGAFGQGEILRAALVMQMTGTVLCDSMAEAAARKKLLRGLAGGNDQLRMTVRDELETSFRYVTVKRATIPTVSRPNFPYALDLVAIDPRRYSLEVEDSATLPVAGGGMTWPVTWPVSWGAVGSLGRVEFFNSGTAPSWPLFRVRGGFPEGFILAEVGTGREIRYVGAVPDTSWIYINPRTGRASIDGLDDRTTDLERSDWWFVGPGESSVVDFASLGGVSGSPVMETTFASASW